MKAHINKKPVAKKLNRKKVEDNVLTYHQGATAIVDIEFGEVEVKFNKHQLFQRGQNFREFNIQGIYFKLASQDEKKMTLTYLFH